jgi:hypothetical protein
MRLPWIAYEIGKTSYRERVDRFIDRAISDAKDMNDKTRLLIAMEQNLPQLWESEEARKLLALIVEKGSLGQRGKSPKHAKRAQARNALLWMRVWYWHGFGLAIWDKTKRDNETACGKASEGSGLTPEGVHKIFLNMKKERLINPAMLFRMSGFFHAGQRDAGLPYNSKKLDLFTFEYMGLQLPEWSAEKVDDK